MLATIFKFDKRLNYRKRYKLWWFKTGWINDN